MPPSPAVTADLDHLVRLLDLEPIEENIFRGTSPQDDRQRVFGGQVAGQALVAAGRTVERGLVHSLHAYFLRPGDTRVPILYEVDRIRDGRSFTTRRVVAIQHGLPIFNLSASFHIDESGFDHQRPMPEVPDPESLPTWPELASARPEIFRRILERPQPIDWRYIDIPSALLDSPKPPAQRVWLRADGRLPDDPLLHACVVAYASDSTLLDVALLPHGVTWHNGGISGASLDHAMWFHDRFRADEWLLYDQESDIMRGARGLTRGCIYTRDGRLVVSVVQEGLMRPGRPRPEAAG